MSVYDVYEQNIGRLGIRLNNMGRSVVTCLDGYNDSCRTLSNEMSVSELRDLQYIVGRAIEAHMTLVDMDKSRR